MDELAPELHDLAQGFGFCISMMSDAQLGSFTEFMRTKDRPDVVTVLEFFARVRESGEAAKLLQAEIEEVTR